MEFSRPFDTCSALSRTQDFGLQDLAAAQLAELGAPCVREATLHIGAPYTPATLHIVVRNLSPECTTIRSITWNGQPVTDSMSLPASLTEPTSAKPKKYCKA